jgi:putative oxidoreductase
MKSSGLSRLTPYLLSILRIVAASLFIAHGTQKLFAYPTAAPRPTVALQSRLGAAGVLEAFGGTLMLVGLFSRPAAFILSGEMAAAYLIQHAPNSRWPILNGGELAVLYCFIWLFFLAAGPGPFSLDAVIRKRA